MTDLPSKARVVIIGGGISGCSVAYHLAKLGWTNIVLLERKQLTSGHDLARRRPHRPAPRLAEHDAAREIFGRPLCPKLEEETGVATGMRQCGLDHGRALTEERKEEIYRQATLARAFDVDGQRDLAR